MLSQEINTRHVQKKGIPKKGYKSKKEKKRERERHGLTYKETNACEKRQEFLGCSQNYNSYAKGQQRVGPEENRRRKLSQHISEKIELIEMPICLKY